VKSVYSVHAWSVENHRADGYCANRIRLILSRKKKYREPVFMLSVRGSERVGSVAELSSGLAAENGRAGRRLESTCIRSNSGSANKESRIIKVIMQEVLALRNKGQSATDK
jgi:hypothetical protein